MIDPQYMLCEGKFKQVNKRFKKAMEIVLRVIVREASQYIEYSAPLVMDLNRQYLQSDGFTAIRRIWAQLKGIDKNCGNAALDPNFLQEQKYFALMALTVAYSSMSDDTAYYDEALPNFDRNTLENIMMC